MSSDFLEPACRADRLDLFPIRRAILEALRQNLHLFRGELLDVGCGRMPYKPLLTGPGSQVTRYIGLDVEGYDAGDARPDITWQDGSIPLPDGSVDSALATEVFEHCPEPERVMAEICRVLRPGAPLFFTVPFLWPLHEVPHDEYRFTPFALQRLLETGGFVDVQLTATGGWDAALAQILGLWVRRRPLPRLPRAALSYLALPLIRLLMWSDRPPAGFRESTMITGLAGTARKPAAP